MSVSTDMALLYPAICTAVTVMDDARALGNYHLADSMRALLRHVRVGEVVPYGIKVSSGKDGSDWEWATVQPPKPEAP